MARNPVQFQKGLSLSDFNARYGREEQCHAALIEMRWPEVAVQTRGDKPIYTQLRCVAGFTNSEIKAYAAASIEAGSPVATDGLACFAALTSAGMMHRPIVTGGGRPDEPEFKWVNTGLGNIKSAITGTCRAVRPRHAARYLAAFEYRFNRRFELDKMVERLATVAAKTTPQPRYVISPEVMSG